jgi:hypothetical protein
MRVHIPAGSDASGTDMQGFPTRAGELLKLGGTFFLGFGPLIGVTVGAVALTYLVLAPAFRYSNCSSMRSMHCGALR